MKYVALSLCLVFLQCKNKEPEHKPDFDIKLLGHFLGKNKDKIVPNVPEYYLDSTNEYWLLKITNNTPKDVFLRCKEGGNTIGFDIVTSYTSDSLALEGSTVSISCSFKKDFKKLIKSKASANLIMNPWSERGITHLKLPFVFDTDSGQIIRKEVVLKIKDIPFLESLN